MDSASEKATPSTRNVVITLLVLAAVVGAGLWFARKLEAPGRLDLEHLKTTSEAVLKYHLDNGHPPETLDLLFTEGYLDTKPVDRIGNPLVYKISEDNTVELLTTGADGEEGGHMFKADTSISFQLPKP